jgi:hypothetical protein
MSSTATNALAVRGLFDAGLRPMFVIELVYKASLAQIGILAVDETSATHR